jgi:2-dehydro-3-deoxyphosphogalactonate aldolase
MKPFVDAGANGFGLGSALFAPGMSAAEVGGNARRFAEAWEALRS